MVLSLFLFLVGNGSGVFSPVDVAASPYKFGLAQWEITHLPQKWWHKLVDLLPWNDEGREERREKLMEFFRLGEEIRTAEHELEQKAAQGLENFPEEGLASQRDRLEEMNDRQSDISAFVEESLEQEISSILADEGLSWKIGIVFPPVDLVFFDRPRVLVISPRDRIKQIKTILLKPDITLEEMEALEEKLFVEQDLSALVEGIGGVATYPSIISGKGGLLRAARLGVHEWLHQFWFFRPLGWNFNSSSEMRTLNESAADLADDEFGQMVYEAITGHKPPEVEQPATSSGEVEEPPTAEVDPDAFDFGEEMRKTRLRVDELLASGQIGDAERFMEERRQHFVDNGFFIRKLNQAFFAFNGTYASNPASISPIKGQLEQVRASVDSVGDFIRTMAGFGSIEEFESYLSEILPVAEPVLAQ